MKVKLTLHCSYALAEIQHGVTFISILSISLLLTEFYGNNVVFTVRLDITHQNKNAK